ncbi:MAG: pyridoxal-phosphate dependent enzyme [Gammaproteobacteria bacterium]|jgi:threonine dehydratase|nr:pyridoxal-phosphate dependent enzyme [Gammaproteobacteria bacterium]MDX2460680.1 pyridoxal-phosphate dependent enzyme [Gammaproteobacteria bacterium]
MYEDIVKARERLRGYAHVTPVMSSRALNGMTSSDVHLKCENFQRAGAFKFRGALNAISKLSDPQRERGVLAFGSGNHPQAVALVGQLLKIKTTVIVPVDAPLNKRQAARDYGATVIEFDPRQQAREEIAEKLVSEHGYALIPPFDHLDVIAGQGTATLEFLEEVGSLDVLLVPCGGGGLLSGSAIAAHGTHPSCRVIGVEPASADDATRSFRTNTLCTVNNPSTIADGAKTSSLGKFTYPLVLEHADDIVTVSEDAIVEAMRLLFFRTKIVVEPTGALGVAALLSGAVEAGSRVGVILSGGNIDPAMVATIYA